MGNRCFIASFSNERFCDGFVAEYEKEHAVSIPDNDFSMDDFKLRQEARIKGKTKIIVEEYNKNKPFAPASFPPEFPQKAWEFMKSWKK